MSSETKSEPKKQESFAEIMNRSAKRALGGGVAGASAMVVQVSSLMWMRTAMNYQYRYGTTTTEAFRHLWKDGGVLRFYRGYWAALAQGPLSRFGDTASNTGMLALLDSYDSTKDLAAAQKTFFASGASSAFRVFLTPVDTVKTIMQVEGRPGLKILFDKAKVKGPTVYYHGALATASANFAGNYPWFATYNTLQEAIPRYEETHKRLGRSAFIGFCSSLVSDCVSNPLRVIKTVRQTSATTISYYDTVTSILEKDGLVGMWGRGLKTRIATNAMQAMMFTVMWNQFMDWMKEAGYMK